MYPEANKVYRIDCFVKNFLQTIQRNNQDARGIIVKSGVFLDGNEYKPSRGSELEMLYISCISTWEDMFWVGRSSSGGFESSKLLKQEDYFIIIP